MIGFIIHNLWKVAWLKTLYFNYKYFSFKDAIKLPVLIYRHTDLYSTNGKIHITCPIQTAMVKIGVPETYTLDMKNNRTKWKVDGSIIVNGHITIERGCCIRLIGKDSVLHLGHNILFTGGSNVICNKEISIGDNCLISWDVLIMDTDFHHIMNPNGIIINPPAPIKIGRNTWIGCQSTILKGTSIADNNVIAANSTITHSFEESNSIIGGQGETLRIIRNNIQWKR